jgi:hypothetical protein
LKGLKISVQAEIRDKNGKVLKHVRKRLSKSYVRQMMDFIYMFNLSASSTFINTSGVSKTASITQSASSGFCGKVVALADNDLYGIQVGTGVTTPDIEDYCLTTKIAHGAGAGQLNYGLTVLGAVAIVGSTAKFTIARPFVNNSGNDIDVKEVGLVIAFEESSEDLFYVMLEHTLLSFTISNGTSGTVTYTISVTC